MTVKDLRAGREGREAMVKKVRLRSPLLTWLREKLDVNDKMAKRLGREGKYAEALHRATLAEAYAFTILHVEFEMRKPPVDGVAKPAKSAVLKTAAQLDTETRAMGFFAPSKRKGDRR